MAGNTISLDRSSICSPTSSFKVLIGEKKKLIDRGDTRSELLLLFCYVNKTSEKSHIFLMNFFQ